MKWVWTELVRGKSTPVPGWSDAVSIKPRKRARKERATRARQTGRPSGRVSSIASDTPGIVAGLIRTGCSTHSFAVRSGDVPPPKWNVSSSHGSVPRLRVQREVGNVRADLAQAGGARLQGGRPGRDGVRHGDRV